MKKKRWIQSEVRKPAPPKKAPKTKKKAAPAPAKRVEKPASKKKVAKTVAKAGPVRTLRKAKTVKKPAGERPY